MRPTLLLTLLALACSPEPEPDGDTPISDPGDVPFPIEEVDLTRFVDPFLGTDGPGNVIPGALVPHGMVRASPDTASSSPTSIDAYEHGDGAIEGFTHTHLEGPGGSANGYSQVLVLPQTGDLVTDRDARPAPFDPDNETARPGHYGVVLDSGIEVELTATAHAAVHRITFPAGPARLIIDLGHSNGQSVGGELDLRADGFDALARYNVHPVAALVTSDDGRTAYTRWHVTADVDVASTHRGTFVGPGDPIVREADASVTGPWAGGWLGWTFDEPTTVELRVGLSRIDADHARTHLDDEVGERTFDEVVDAADAAWNSVLNRVQITADDDTAALFYTALYRSAFQPADYTEAGREFVVATSGEDVVHSSKRFRWMTDDWCMWDTFRTSHPLGTLVEPEWRDDIARSLLWAYEDGGWLPKCTWNATGYSRVMIGNHAVPILADAAVKDLLPDVDPDLLWEAVDHAGMQDIDLLNGLCGYINLGTPPDYLELGYVPTECDPGQSVSMTVEHAYDDWTTARLAEAIGRPAADVDRYDARGDNWRAHLDPDTKFLRGRNRQGEWRTPFDPAEWSDFNDFTEATSWIYSFFVPHDLAGLTEGIGGPTTLHERLDTFFADGHFDPSNQPSFHIPWMYGWAGDPSATQARVRSVMEAHYTLGRGGLPGNDDAGSTSAWLVYAMLGLYPMAPGDGRYVLVAPRVAEATVHLHPGFYDGGSFRIETDGDPATQPYVASATLNGDALDRTWITHDEIVAGGTLRFELSATPTDWGEGDSAW